MAYEKAWKENKEAEKKLTIATEAYNSYRGIDKSPPEKIASKKATGAKSLTSKTTASVINQVFMLYSNLLMKEACQPWTKIVKEQIGSEPWTDLCRINQPKKHT